MKHSSGWFEKLRQELSRAASLPELLDGAAAAVGHQKKAALVEITLAQGAASIRRVFETTREKRALPGSRITITGRSLSVDDREVKTPLLVTSREMAVSFGVKSLLDSQHSAAAVLPVYLAGKLGGFIYVCWAVGQEPKSNTMDELALVASLVAAEANRFLHTGGVAPTMRLEFHRLVDVGQLIVLRTDAEFVVTELMGNTQALLGVSPDELLNDPDVWSKIFVEDDLRRIRKRLRDLKLAEELQEEVCLLNRRTQTEQWLLVRGVMLRADDGSIRGWEMYGFDITEKHRTEQVLINERARLQALFDVAQAVQAATEPELVCLRGIRALATATQSDCALAAFRAEATDRIELVAVHGFAENNLGALDAALEGNSIVRRVVERSQSTIINDIEHDPNVAARDVMAKEKLLSAVVAPLRVENSVVGAIALFSRKKRRYSTADQELLEAAVVQINGALTTANIMQARRADYARYNALYQLSHELARLTTLRDIAMHTVRVVSEVLPIERVWLGLTSSGGESLVGHAGDGAGMRASVIESVLPVVPSTMTGEPPVAMPKLGLVMRERAVSIVKISEAELGERLGPLMGGQSLIAVPAVSLNQTVGVILIQPRVKAVELEHRFPVLQALGAEMAAVILSRRLEAKMAESDKMRVTGLLAAGVAHNFNNILQAIMGQATLVDLQLPADSKLKEASKHILDSAQRGAHLVKQLSSFSQVHPAARRTLHLEEFFSESQELYSSVLSSRIRFNLETKATVPPVYADQSQVQQVVTNLLVNAKEAIGLKSDGVVGLKVAQVRVRPGEHLNGIPPGLYVSIEVSDNGVGMSQEQKERCFEPFFSTKAVDQRSGVSLEGAGLGLSSAYSIVRQHDGFLLVDSALGAGTTFRVFLPALTVVPEDKPSGSRATSEAVLASPATTERAPRVDDKKGAES